MDKFNDFLDILSASVFGQLISASGLRIGQYNAFVLFLIKNDIPFDSNFTPGTRRDDPELSLVIYLAPKTTITLSFSEFSLTDS